MLSWNEFLQQGEFLIKRSHSLSDPEFQWEWRTTHFPEDQNRDGMRYLVKARHTRQGAPLDASVTSPTFTVEAVGDEVGEILEWGVSEEDPALATSPTIVDTDEVTTSLKQPFGYEIHVLYSTTYRTPMLYFNIYDSESRVLTADEVLATITKHSRDQKNIESAAVTQGEHPVASVPFYFIHPCNTSSVMRTLVPSDATAAPQQTHYLASWLSWVAPFFRFSVPVMMFNVE